MINVVAQAEPANFNGSVRKPGAKFLAVKPKPTSREFSKHNYWRLAKKDLHNSYKGICAYTCFYMPTDYSVDHFLPKSSHPAQAYEWNNFRLALKRVNQHKDSSLSVIDPFLVQPGWFVLDFPSCLIKAGAGLAKTVQTQVEDTIKALKLNDDDTFVQDRCDIMLDFAEKRIDLSFLSKRYPFLASEVVRQGLQATAHNVFKKRTV